MESFELRDADAALLEQIAALAEIIWHEHYESILGVDQVNYMVEHFQSLPAMKAQIANRRFFFPQCDEAPFLINRNGICVEAVDGKLNPAASRFCFFFENRQYL